MHEDSVECPGIVAQEEILKYEFKMEHDLNEFQKDERKALMHSLKKFVEEGSSSVKK